MATIPRRDLTESILAWGQSQPDQVALHIRGQSVTSAELRHAALSVSADLQESGYPVGAIVGVYLRTSAAFFAAYLGIQHAGMVPLVLNAMLRQSELADIFDRVGPVAVWAEEELLEFALKARSDSSPEIKSIDSSYPIGDSFAAVDPEPERRLADSAALMMTSGSTGRSKAVRVSHHSLTVSASWCAWAMDLIPGGTILSTVPTFYDMGLHTASLPGLHLRHTIVIQERYDSVGTLDLLRTWNPDVLVGTPTMHRRTIAEMDRQGFVQPSLRTLYSSGAALDPTTASRLGERFPSCSIRQVYGLSETRAQTGSGKADVPPLESVGRPMPGVVLRIVPQDGEVATEPGEVGEIWLKSAGIMDGYVAHEGPQPFEPGGWFKTGDLGRVDAEGWLHFSGRLKEMIVRGGANVYPREIEVAVGRFQGIGEVAVVGIPHEDLDEVPVLFYSTEEGAHIPPDSVEEYCRDALAAYKVPIAFFPVDGIPKHNSGKVAKSLLVERAKLLHES